MRGAYGERYTRYLGEKKVCERRPAGACRLREVGWWGSARAIVRERVHTELDMYTGPRACTWATQRAEAYVSIRAALSAIPPGARECRAVGVSGRH